MKNTNETDFEKDFNKIKKSKVEIKTKYKKGENKMKTLKKINWKKIIETAKTIVIYTAIVASVAFYFGAKFGENNAKTETAKIVETVRNLSK